MGKDHREVVVFDRGWVYYPLLKKGTIAQWLEHRTHKKFDCLQRQYCKVQVLASLKMLWCEVVYAPANVAGETPLGSIA